MVCGRRYHSTTIALLIGFMIGALRAVWPFWSYRYITIPTQLAKGAQLQAVEPILPDIASPLFFLALACGLGGFLLVFLLEKSENKGANTEHEDREENIKT